MTKIIALTQGKVCRVDDKDFEYFSQWKWQARFVKGKWYARRLRKIYMHREIMNAPDGMEVDHRDGDGLNNQRHNLRVCTPAQNHASRKKNSNNTSGYKGVSKCWNKWKAQLNKGGKLVFWETFATAEEAARAYDKAARKHFGEFAVLNFPEITE